MELITRKTETQDPVSLLERISCANRLARRFLSKTKRGTLDARIKAKRLRFSVLAKVQELENSIYQFKANPEAEREVLIPKMAARAHLLEQVLVEAEDFESSAL